MTDQATRAVAAGWYDDPSSTESVRWWNGAEWTDHTREKPATRPQPNTAASTSPATSDVPMAPELNADQVRELERRFLYDGDAAAQSFSESPTGAKFRRKARRPIDLDNEQLFGAHTGTGSVWLIAFSPVIAAITSIAVAYFYLYVNPQPLVLIATAIPFLLSLLWATTDTRKLRDWGNTPASAAWALLGPLVYLIARRVKIAGSGPLVAFLIVLGTVIALPAAAWSLGAVQPVATALTIQNAIRADLVGSGEATSVTCPPFASASTVGTIFTCDVVTADGTSRTVIVSIDSDHGDFSYAYATN